MHQKKHPNYQNTIPSLINPPNCQSTQDQSIKPTIRTGRSKPNPPITHFPAAKNDPKKKKKKKKTTTTTTNKTAKNKH